ncbi:MAG: hypothetical protein P1Q69_12810 [Candidatus Thorarchaeota archaeon]|nr:hypothetical protein [Candidatus Thorarchaeota archaeon]
MSQETSCPYCKVPGSIGTEDDISTIYIRCTNCGGVFEFMPGFGSFSLPDEGRGFKAARGGPKTRYDQEYVISNDDVPQTGPQAAGCCVLLLILISVFLPIILTLLFGF